MSDRAVNVFSTFAPTYPKRKRTTLEMTGTAPALVLISVVMWALHSGHCIDTESGPNILVGKLKNPVFQVLPNKNELQMTA